MLNSLLSKLFFSLCVLATLTLVACSTPYKPLGLMGGYSEVQYEKNIWQVSFKGNGYSDEDHAIKMAMLRSAEITLAQGYKFFAVVNEKIFNRTTGTVTDTYGSASATGNTVNFNSSSITSIITKPSAHQTIVMFKKKPKKIVSYNATMICNSLGKQFGAACANSNLR